MKRILTSILAILYMVTASGAMVHLHYCMGELEGISLVENNGKSHECSKCGMIKSSNNGCCKDKQQLVKADQDHVQTATIAFEPSKILFHVVSLPYAFDFKTTLAEQLLLSENIHSPPDKWRNRPIYIQVRNIRI